MRNDRPGFDREAEGVEGTIDEPPGPLGGGQIHPPLSLPPPPPPTDIHPPATHTPPHPWKEPRFFCGPA